MELVFGPVPSRRLGSSLGVNNVPFKHCTYSCVYCQVGRTRNLTIERRMFYDPEEIVRAIEERFRRVLEAGVRVDYVTFAPDGEPVLDANLGRVAEAVRSSLGVRVAVLTNASLMWRADVREDLEAFDLVSVKVDAIREGTWKFINRPHPGLKLGEVLEGMLTFRDAYRGTLITETMLINDIEYGDEVAELAEFLEELRPSRAYVAVPTRPPAEPWVRPADSRVVSLVYEEVARRLGWDRVETLTTVEPPRFTVVEEVVRDLTAVLSVHPMHEEALREYLRRAGKPWSVVEELIEQGRIARVSYNGRSYYVLKRD